MPRKVWVSTTAFIAGGPTIADNIARARQLLELACAERPDIVCLSETFAYLGVKYRAAEVAEPVPGPITDMAAEVARRHSTYIICPLLEQRGGKVYNVAVLLDRQGQIVGTYEKVHPVTTTADYTELEYGVTPGVEPKVLQTDFGRIGILICFDLMFPREWARLKAKGAEIVFWASAYNGGFPLQTYASLHHYYVVSAVNPDRARIVDITGRIIAMTSRRNPVISAELDLEKGLYHTDFNAVQIPAIRAHYGRDVLIQVYGDEAMFTLESRREDLAVAQIEAEFGLERLDDYLARNAGLHDTLREGKTPIPQQTPYLGRQQWV